MLPLLPLLPLRPGLAAKATHDYERNGSTCLFAALEVAPGKVSAHECYKSHTHTEFLRFCKNGRQGPARA